MVNPPAQKSTVFDKLLISQNWFRKSTEDCLTFGGAQQIASRGYIRGNGCKNYHRSWKRPKRNVRSSFRDNQKGHKRRFLTAILCDGVKSPSQRTSGWCPSQKGDYFGYSINEVPVIRFSYYGDSAYLRVNIGDPYLAEMSPFGQSTGYSRF